MMQIIYAGHVCRLLDHLRLVFGHIFPSDAYDEMGAENQWTTEYMKI
ncbi:hypothetical protein [Paenibacillus sp. yr247]|nr:hypothetical protein [Paenibacillus sp. yr247]